MSWADICTNSLKKGAISFHKAIIDSDIIANYNSIISSAELEPDCHVCKNVLHGIVSLYVFVRSFAFVKAGYSSSL